MEIYDIEANSIDTLTLLVVDVNGLDASDSVIVIVMDDPIDTAGITWTALKSLNQ